VGDPFCFLERTPPNNPLLYRRLNHRVEERVFAAASAVAVTTAATRERYALLFPAHAKKVHVVPPLLPPLAEGEAVAGEPVLGRGRGLRLVFAGTLYRGIRSPAALLDLFAALLETPLGGRLELHLLGGAELAAAALARRPERLRKAVFFHGLVDHGRAVRAICEADVLVNIGNDTPYQLPSKVVEYLSAGKPVLNLVRDGADSSAAFFGDHPAVLSLAVQGRTPLAEDVAAVREFLERARPLDPARRDRLLAPYRLEAVAAAYEALLA
jgi:glycosyltransferase involved in cell wall biosynthesis